MIKIDDKGNVSMVGQATDILSQWATLSYAIAKEFDDIEIITKAFAAGVSLYDMKDEDLKKIGFSDAERILISKAKKDRNNDIFRKMFGDLLNE